TGAGRPFGETIPPASARGRQGGFGPPGGGRWRGHLEENRPAGFFITPTSRRSHPRLTSPTSARSCSGSTKPAAPPLGPAPPPPSCRLPRPPAVSRFAVAGTGPSSAVLVLGFDHPLDGPQDQLGEVGDPELVLDPGPEGLDGLGTDVHLFGDHLGRQPLADELKRLQ